MGDSRRSGPEAGDGTAGQAPDSLAPFAILTLLLRRRRILVGVPFTVLVIAIVVLLIRGRTYSADSTFKPQAGESPQGRLAGIAAQLGIVVPGAPLGDPVKYYTDLATSRELLTAVINTVYRIHTGDEPADTASGDLIRLFKVNVPRTVDRTRIALDRLRNRVIVTNDREAGLVYIRTISAWPDLSEQINRRILDLLNESNQTRRQSQAAAEREFVEGRLRQGKAELEEAEAAQAAFLHQNRRYQDSPDLQLEYGRLQRRVDLRQQVYLQLAQSYEQARIDEVRDTPLLMIIDRPEGSARRYGSRAKDALVWLFVGVVLALLLAISADYLETQRRANGLAYSALRAEAGAAFGRIRWTLQKRVGEPPT